MAAVKHLTTEELAERLGIEPRTADDWRVDGRGPKFIRFGRTVRYRVADVEAWEKSCLVDPAAREPQPA